MITVIAKCVLIENKNNEFKKLANELIKETVKEEGCISYTLNENINDENILTFIEEWESEKHLQDHMKSEHFVSIVPKLGELQKQESSVKVFK